MTIQPLGRGSLALALSNADLSGLPGVSLEDLNGLQLIRFLRRTGVNLPPRTRIEAYSQRDAWLLFVHPPRRPRHFAKFRRG